MTPRKTFTPYFKLAIAKLMVDEDYSVKQACDTSGAGATAVKRWRQQYLAEKAGKPLVHHNALTEEPREVQQLKQRIKQLEMEREILKKATAFFAKEMR